MCVVSVPVENGGTEADMNTEEETWEQKEEPGGGGGGGGQEEPGSGQEGAAAGKEGEETIEEEEEEMPVPKAAPVQPDAPKKEHVNVVFIGHVGTLGFERENGGRILLDIGFTSSSLFLLVLQTRGSRPSEDRSCENSGFFFLPDPHPTFV